MSLIQRLQSVNDRLSGLPAKFGDPRYRLVVAVHPQDGYVELLPTPKISSIGGYMATRYLQSGVEISTDDVYVTGISRSYSEAWLKKCKYILDAVADGSNYTGQKAELIDIVTSEMLTYGLVLRKLRGR